MLAAMSSSNQHIPPAVKRSASSISNSAEALFPKLPDLSYEDVADFAHQVQEALNQTLLATPGSKKQPTVVRTQVIIGQETMTLLDDPDVSFVYLPLISPHRLSYRFSIADGNSVFVVSRKPYRVLKEALLGLNTEVYSGIYLR